MALHNCQPDCGAAVDLVQFRHLVAVPLRHTAVDDETQGMDLSFIGA